MRKIDPLTAPNHKTQKNVCKDSGGQEYIHEWKTAKHSADQREHLLYPDILVSLPPLDYNIVDDMKKTKVNINLFKLAKIQSQWDILFFALGLTTMDSAASTSKGENTPLRSLSTVFNALWMEETSSVCPPFLLSFEIFNCNVHNCLVDFSTAYNVMPLSIAKKVNAQWSETSMWIIQLNWTLVPTIGELWGVIIQLSHDDRVHQCINIVVVDILKAYGLLLSRDWSPKLDGYFAIDWTHMWFPYKGK